MAIRVGIVGARRNVQGIGEYVARDLAALGADVRAIVGTRQETLQSARENLLQRFELDVRGYLDLAEMIKREDLDAVAICSPQEFHREQLQICAEYDQHVLCEKPMVFSAVRDNAADAKRLADLFAQKRRILMVNQQWPCTLGAFGQCYPDAKLDTAIRKLSMVLAPSEDGADMIPNAMPHVCSMLLALVPCGGSCEDLLVERPGGGELRIGFRYAHHAGTTEVSTRLLQVTEQPRPAAFAINGCAVVRKIKLPQYEMFLEAESAAVMTADWPSDRLDARRTSTGHGIALEDPLRLLLAEFIRQVREGCLEPAADPTLWENVRLVEQIYKAACDRLSLK